MALPGTCNAGIVVAEAILWVILAGTILIGCALAVSHKGVAVDDTLSKIADTACVSDQLALLDVLAVSSKAAFAPQWEKNLA